MKSGLCALAGLVLVTLPACLPSSSTTNKKRDASDATTTSAEVSGPADAGAASDATDARDDGTAETDASTGEAAPPSDNDADGVADADAAMADREPDLFAPDAVDEPVEADAALATDADDGPASLDGPPIPVDVGPDVSDGASDAHDVPIGNSDGAGDGVVDTDGNRDAAVDTRDGRGGEVGALDGAIDGGGSCCGCLCRDPSWSCSHDTCLDPAGHAVGLAAEAGFLELGGGDYTSEGQVRSSPIHRIWYSFQPATTAPESKPLAVFFNGGPGSSTSAYLFCLNTAPYTLDPAFTGSGVIASNASTWTGLANLLYVDAPATGFSYPLPLANGSAPSVGIDLDRDAASVVRVIVRFLARHPALQGNRVMLVGESYGGTRATLMLGHLFTYQTLIASNASYKDRDLYDDLVRHFTAAFPGEDATKLTAERIATQFGHQVLIQPVVAGDAQWLLQDPDTSVCTSSYDVYQCNRSSGWSDGIAHTAAGNLVKIANLRQALGVDPTTIDWLYASARGKAYGRSSGIFVDTTEMTTTFGQLGSDDAFFLMRNDNVLFGYASGARDWHDPTIGEVFVADLARVSTFITNAKFDTVVWTPAIAPALASYTSLVSSATIDTAARTGFARPGWIAVSFVAGAFPGVSSREIRFPFYAQAGHTVSIADSANLLADVTQWYAASLAAAPAAPAAPAPAARAVTRAQSRSATPSSDRTLYLGP